MNPKDVQIKLIEVLQGIQSDSGYDTSRIVETTCPLKDLEGFDSMLWPVTISILATELKLEIPNDKNIFLSDDGKQFLTISESAIVVCKLFATNEVMYG